MAGCACGSVRSRRCACPCLNPRSDHFERADESFDYGRWRMERAFPFVLAQAFVGRFLATFREVPPRQTPASLSLDQVMAKPRQSAPG
jgi:hypothetical protein